MAYVATVVRDDAQADGRRWLLLRFTHDASAPAREQWRKVDAGVNAQAFADTLAGELEAREQASDKARLQSAVRAGIDPDTLTSPFFTIAQIRRAAFRYLINGLKRIDSEPEFMQVARKLSVCVERYTDAQIAGAIGWTDGQVANVRARISAHVTASDGLIHAEPEIDE